MGDLKIKQHYVWKKYLRPWTADDKNIWVKILNSNVVKEVPLASVGQEKKFYQLETITEAEEKFISDFIKIKCPASVRPLLEDFLIGFTLHSKLRKELEDLKLDPYDARRKLIEDNIKEIEMNTMENVHCFFENFGNKLTDCKVPQDVFFMADHINFMETIMFLAVQYFRTKKMRNNVLKGFEDNPYKIRPEKLWNIMSFAMAAKFAADLTLSPGLRIRIYDNRTDLQFLTNDQPVFNVLGDSKDKEGFTTELELYFPITPRLALCLHFKSQHDLIESVVVDRETVKFFNDKMILNAEGFIFAESECQLSEIELK